jgi:hypothetical protein
VSLFALRLRTQRVTGAPFAAPADADRILTAVQSQDYLGAKWSVGQRVRGATDAAIDEAFSRGDFVRTHVLRPTWHFVAPEDVRLLLQATAARVHALNAFMYRGCELDSAVLSRTRKVLIRELANDTHLTRAEVAAKLERAGIVAEGQRLAYIMMHAELEGLVCSGRLRGKQQTYALLDERIAATQRLSDDEALCALVHRFFAGHAPATLKHFVWWSSLTLKHAKAGVEMVGNKLPSFVLKGETWYGAAKPHASRSTSALLIPEYDESLVGGRDLGVTDLEPRARVRGPDYLRPIIIGDRRAGTWRRVFEGRRVEIETSLVSKLGSTHERALRAAIGRYRQFLGAQRR